MIYAGPCVQGVLDRRICQCTKFSQENRKKIAIASPKGGFAPQSAPDAHGALGRAGFFDYPQRSIFTLRDRSGPVKQTLVSIWSSDGLTSVPQDGRYVTRIALMSSRRLLPSRGLHCTEIPRFPGRGRRQGTNHIAGLWGPGTPLFIPLGRFSFDPHISLFHWAKTQS